MHHHPLAVRFLRNRPQMLLLQGCCDEAVALGFLGHLEGSPQLHQTGRQELIDGLKLVGGDSYEPSQEMLQTLGAISDLESSYGRGWSGPMVGSNNWGAITCGKSPDESGACPPGCSPNKDSSPYSGEYVTCFRRWDTPAEGAAGLIKLLSKWPEVIAAIESGNLDEVSWTMRQRNYYLGFKTDPREAAREHAGALEKRTKEIAEALGEPLVAYRKGEDWTPGGGGPSNVASKSSNVAKGLAVASFFAALGIILSKR